MSHKLQPSSLLIFYHTPLVDQSPAPQSPRSNPGAATEKDYFLATIIIFCERIAEYIYYRKSFQFKSMLAISGQKTTVALAFI